MASCSTSLKIGLLCTVTFVLWENFVLCVSKANIKYLAIPERAAITYFNPEYLGPDNYFLIRRLNRTHFATSFQFEMLKDVEDAQASLDVEQFLNNEYKKTGIYVAGLICDLISDEDTSIFKEYIMDGVHGNIPACEGTLPKGKYFVKDAIMSGEISKRIFIPGRWKVEYRTKTKDDVTMLIAEFYYKIEEIIA